MKKYINRLIAATALLISTINPALAQQTRSGYFVEDYTYRFQMNPAMGNSMNFVSMPALANMNIAMNGNLHLTDILYNVNGKTTTFLNPEVSTKQVLSNLSNVNRIGADIKLNILAGGFHAWGGYNTVAISARTAIDAKLPKSLFAMLKEGIENKEYNISNVNARAIAYAELAFGHSRELNDEWRIGATMKFLIGGARMDAQLHNANLVLGTDNWTITSNGQINANVKGLNYELSTNKTTGKEYVSGMKLDGTGVNGFGIAFDLGAVFNPDFMPELTLSASLLDLGFIGWSNGLNALTDGEHTFNSDDYIFNVDDKKPNSFKNEWQNMSDNLATIYQLNDMGNTGSRTSGVGSTFNIGAEYRLPVYDKLTFGLLNTTRIAGIYSWTDFRLSANIAPCDIFSASANIAEGTFGFSFGWLANLHLKGFNMFLGMDHTLGKLAKQGVPLSSNAQANIGINFLF
ncbi:MAG: hypothetical protein K2H44_01550 [Muribaculaceae bacterium]|nr:hypothetical protein [Muribaculaceae bacterium]